MAQHDHGAIGERDAPKPCEPQDLRVPDRARLDVRDRQVEVADTEEPRHFHLLPFPAFALGSAAARRRYGVVGHRGNAPYVAEPGSFGQLVR